MPRKIKKVMNHLLIESDGTVVYDFHFRIRHYPHTNWVVRAKREFRRLWIEKIKLEFQAEFLIHELGLLHKEHEQLFASAILLGII